MNQPFQKKIMNIIQIIHCFLFQGALYNSHSDDRKNFDRRYIQVTGRKVTRNQNDEQNDEQHD